MRIGIFTDTYTPYINGVTTSVLMLKKGLEKKGHKVYVISVNPEHMRFSLDSTGNYLPSLPFVGVSEAAHSLSAPARRLVQARGQRAKERFFLS